MMDKKIDQNKWFHFIKSNAVTLMFMVLCLVFMILSGQSLSLILKEIISRFTRNAVLVLSLLIPVLCGLGLNFSIVLGAMAGQIGLFAITHYQIGGIGGLLAASLIGVVFSILFGYGTGKLYNNTVGQEMITGMILGYFAKGLYQLIFLVLLGPVIPMNNPGMMISSGVGLKNTISLDGVKNALENVVSIPLNWFLLLAIGIMTIVILVKIWLQAPKETLKEAVKQNRAYLVSTGGMAAFCLAGLVFPKVNKALYSATVPLVTVAVVALVCLFNVFISRTKLGQDIRTVGQNMAVARASGINVGRVRIIAVIISTGLASLGQIIYLQNMGVVTTYSSHDNVGTYAIAALLVGGASIKKANIGQAFLGIVMFHILFFTSPLVGMKLFNDSQIGEYFRTFISYGVIAVSLVLYVLKGEMEKRRESAALARSARCNG